MTRRPRPLVIRTGRHPHELWMLGACVLAGIGGLVSGAESRAIEAAFPPWGQAAWYGGLLLGGLLGAVGVIRSGQMGLRLEQSGLLFLAGLSLAYTAGALAVVLGSGGSVAFGVVSVAAFAVANLARAWQIPQDLGKLRAALADPRPAEPPLADPGGRS